MRCTLLGAVLYSALYMALGPRGPWSMTFPNMMKYFVQKKIQKK